MNSKVNELQVIEQNAIIVAFQKENGIQDLFDRMAEQARSIVPDVTTKKGRDAIASQAYKVSKSKAAVDNHGKDLVAGIKAQAAAIDRDRKAWRDQCDALRDEIRKPLDDWEQAENDRVAKHQAVIRAIHSLHGENILNKESHEIKGYIFDLENTEIDSSFEEFEQEAKIAKLETLEKLRTALTAREKYEAEQAAKIKADQEAEAARLANKEHMRSINCEILNKLCEIGLDEDQAKAVITAIAKNQIPHISVKY